MRDSSTVDPSPELAECISTLRTILRKMVRLLDATIYRLTSGNTPELLGDHEPVIDGQLASVLAPMIQAAGSSCVTLERLSANVGLQTRDCYGVCRAITEGLINVCYIMAEGKSAAERAWRHTEQKAIRELERESEVGSSTIRLMFSGDLTPESLEEVQALLGEFTSRTGREKPWTDTSVAERLASVGQRFGYEVLMRLHLALFSVYRHSSEILHGTLFGALFFMGLTNPTGPRQRADLPDEVAGQLMLLLFSQVFAVSGFVRAFDSCFGAPEAARAARKFEGEVSEISYFSSSKG